MRFQHDTLELNGQSENAANGLDEATRKFLRSKCFGSIEQCDGIHFKRSSTPNFFTYCVWFGAGMGLLFDIAGFIVFWI